MNRPDPAAQAIAHAHQLARTGQYGAAIRLLSDAIARASLDSPSASSRRPSTSSGLAERETSPESPSHPGTASFAPSPARPEPVEGRSRTQPSEHHSGRTRLIRAFAALAAGLVPPAYKPELDRGLTACFAEDELDCQPLARCAAALLLLKYPEAALEPVGEDPLWIGFLTRCISTDPEMEARLASMRRTALAKRDAAPVRPVAALAIQAFSNEYVWPVGPAEAEQLRGQCSPLLRALYEPLAEAIEGDDDLLRLLIRSSVSDPAEERALAEAMPSLGAVGGPVSAAVRDQYEQHPYPRWRVRPAPRPATLADVLARLPRVDGAILPPPPLDVLVAGCGTGFEAIEIARTDASARVTALDLSRASLAYGRRMAGDVPNLRFVQGDILDVGALGMRFGLITSTGVLHHMESPDAGLAALRDAALPGGILRIALYSERARAPVRAAHALIGEKGLTPDAEGIRALRALVFDAPEGSPLVILRQSDDFYSMSGCRDLLFHVQEHLFTLPKVAALVARAGLTLVGFDAPPDAVRAFRRTDGPQADLLDLASWHELEQRHPFLFAGMYHLWLQKPA